MKKARPGAALPPIGSYWADRANNIFKVLLIANAHMNRSRGYPKTVVFMDNCGAVWSLPISKWRALDFIEAPANEAFVEGLGENAES